MGKKKTKKKYHKSTHILTSFDHCVKRLAPSLMSAKVNTGDTARTPCVAVPSHRYFAMSANATTVGTARNMNFPERNTHAPLSPSCVHMYFPPGDDLSLCLRAVCWLAPRFADLPSSSSSPSSSSTAALDEPSTAAGSNGPQSHGKVNNDSTTTAPPSDPIPATAAPGDDDGDARQQGNSIAAATQDEPLQLLLELAAGRLGAGVDGIHRSLSLMAGALCRGLRGLRVRRAFASSLRAHLATVQVDAVFRFGEPKSLMAAAAAAGGRGGGGGGDAMVSQGRLALPPMLTWATFRKYTATMWVRLSPRADGGGGAPATLFRFRNGEGVGVEATLGAAGGGGGVGKGQQQQQHPQQGRREMVVTSYQRTSPGKSFSARCKFGPQAEAVHLDGGGVGEGVRQGGWRFVVVSHGQPYVKRSGRLRVSVDGVVVLDTELQYPPATGQGSKDPMSR